MTVIETGEFLDRATAILTDDDRESLVAHLAANPMAGTLVAGAGGVRKT